MHLTRYTDYAMRVLLYLGRQPEKLCSITEISGAYAISQNHLMKVVSDLVNAGYLESVRGRHGGIRLARPPSEISVGTLIRHTEEDFELVECSSCLIVPACGLTSVLDEALSALSEGPGRVHARRPYGPARRFLEIPASSAKRMKCSAEGGYPSPLSISQLLTE